MRLAAVLKAAEVEEGMDTTGPPLGAAMPDSLSCSSSCYVHSPSGFTYNEGDHHHLASAHFAVYHVADDASAKRDQTTEACGEERLLPPEGGFERLCTISVLRRICNGPKNIASASYRRARHCAPTSQRTL